MKRKLKFPFRIWTTEENEYLMREWGDIRLRTMSEALSRSRTAIRRQAHRLGLPSVMQGCRHGTQFAQSTGFNDQTVTTVLQQLSVSRVQGAHYKKAKSSKWKILPEQEELLHQMLCARELRQDQIDGAIWSDFRLLNRLARKRRKLKYKPTQEDLIELRVLDSLTADLRKEVTALRRAKAQAMEKRKLTTAELLRLFLTPAGHLLSQRVRFVRQLVFGGGEPDPTALPAAVGHLMACEGDVGRIEFIDQDGRLHVRLGSSIVVAQDGDVQPVPELDDNLELMKLALPRLPNDVDPE